MGRIQLIIRGITTLEEARYFAAMGADWIGFQNPHLPLTQIRSISDWVVGPDKFIEFESLNEDLLFQTVQELQPEGIMLPSGVDIPSWYQGVRIYCEDGQHPLKDVEGITYVPVGSLLPHRDLEKVWIGISPDNTQSLAEALDRLPAGIVIDCLKPQTGIIDFDRYDQLIERYQSRQSV